MRQGSRAERVSGLIQKSLSDLLKKGIKDPRLEMTLITGVKMTQDLRIARIYFTSSVAPGENVRKKRDDTVKGFKSALGFIKRRLADSLGLRYMPDLEFYYDESFDYGSRIDTILKNLEKCDERSNQTPKEKQEDSGCNTC